MVHMTFPSSHWSVPAETRVMGMEENGGYHIDDDHLNHEDKRHGLQALELDHQEDEQGVEGGAQQEGDDVVDNEAVSYDFGHCGGVREGRVGIDGYTGEGVVSNAVSVVAAPITTRP